MLIILPFRHLHRKFDYYFRQLGFFQLFKPSFKMIADNFQPFFKDSACFTDDRGQDYRGFRHTTRYGHLCQKWTEQSPHRHDKTPEKYPDKGLGDHNFCRNPDTKSDGPWCYTTVNSITQQYCAIFEPRISCRKGEIPLICTLVLLLLCKN